MVPDVLPRACEPPIQLTITYPGGLSVKDGMKVSPNKVSACPTVMFNKHTSADRFYTLVMTGTRHYMRILYCVHICITYIWAYLYADPDAPSRSDPQFREFIHWVVVNIPGKDVVLLPSLVTWIDDLPVL